MAVVAAGRTPPLRETGGQAPSKSWLPKSTWTHHFLSVSLSAGTSHMFLYFNNAPDTWRLHTPSAPFPTKPKLFIDVNGKEEIFLPAPLMLVLVLVLILVLVLLPWAFCCLACIWKLANLAQRLASLCSCWQGTLVRPLPPNLSYHPTPSPTSKRVTTSFQALAAYTARKPCQQGANLFWLKWKYSPWRVSGGYLGILYTTKFCSIISLHILSCIFLYYLQLFFTQKIVKGLPWVK